jgi:hypothetical protein
MGFVARGLAAQVGGVTVSATQGTSQSGDTKQPTRRNPLRRLGWPGWIVLAGLIGAAIYFWRPVVKGLYMGVWATAFGVQWAFDWLFGARETFDRPWIMWALWGAVLGACLGFWLIAPTFGLRRWRTPLLFLPVVAMIGVAVLALLGQGPASRAAGAHADRYGPVVYAQYARNGSDAVTVKRNRTVAIDYIVHDQAMSADITLRIYRKSKVVKVKHIGVKPTNRWLKFDLHAALPARRPARTYKAMITAVDPAGHEAVREQRLLLQVRPPKR